MILVTGAGGTVGGELVKQLQASGAKFRAGYHSPEMAEKAKRAGIDAVPIDYAASKTVASALEGVDRLFRLGSGGAGQTEAEIGVAEEATRWRVEHVVKLSVWGAGGEAFSFAKVHRPVERAIETSALAWTFLRPNGFMQNLANFFGPTIKTQAFHIPSRGCRISHVDVRDIAAVAAIALIAEPGGQRSARRPSSGRSLARRQAEGSAARATRSRRRHRRRLRFLLVSQDEVDEGPGRRRLERASQISDTVRRKR